MPSVIFTSNTVYNTLQWENLSASLEILLSASNRYHCQHTNSNADIYIFLATFPNGTQEDYNNAYGRNQLLHCLRQFNVWRRGWGATGNSWHGFTVLTIITPTLQHANVLPSHIPSCSEFTTVYFLFSLRCFHAAGYSTNQFSEGSVNKVSFSVSSSDEELPTM